jgi:hypothetical protein
MTGVVVVVGVVLVLVLVLEVVVGGGGGVGVGVGSCVDVGSPTMDIAMPRMGDFVLR